MATHMENRTQLIQSLKEELVGPSPQGEELDCSGEIHFEDAKESYGPWRQKTSGEEILMRDRPVKRYGVGVLYTIGVAYEAEPEGFEGDIADLPSGEESALNTATDPLESPLTGNGAKSIEEIEKRTSEAGERSDPDDFDLSTANSYRPSSMGVSFLAGFPEGSKLEVKASGGRYVMKKIQAGDKEFTWWLRVPVSLVAEFDSKDICSDEAAVISPSSLSQKNVEGLDVRLEMYSRPQVNKAGRMRLVTLCLVNRAKASGSYDETCLFQSHFKATIMSPDKNGRILPYPKPPSEYLDEEEQSLELLYRKVETFAVGHGCAADWGDVNDSRKAGWVSAVCLPVQETPSITPDIIREDGTPIQVSMAALAGFIPGDDGFGSLTEVIERFENWIEERANNIPSLDSRYQPPARRHIQECLQSARRMREGLDYLSNDLKAMRAFKLANHAMLLQQIQSRRVPRAVRYDPKEKRVIFSEAYVAPDPATPPPGRGMWRPFQIAFFLMAVRSVGEGDAPDRRTVELIWFPTGGGKTEAYLGLAAYSLFLRRLRNPEDAGVNVLMRYTLRLLTAQQFLRASGLSCAMEYIRGKYPSEFGEEEFSIGIWLGRGTTPNIRRDAVYALGQLNKGGENLFILDRCPWCGAQIGPVKYKKGTPKNVPRVLGYERQGDTVVFKCSDKNCEFSGGLPVYVIDEDIYEKRPSIIIGTVDKFAMLAWRPEAKSLFGLSPAGEQQWSPPGLIIQDELHLISGPLGSMVGLYETVIEQLCTDNRSSSPIPPKIVCSTATIRRYPEQVKALYGRESVALFPAPGLDAEDSFFARYARNPDGSLQPGRIYVGVHAPGLGSLQTCQVRTFTALLQAPVFLSKEERDPWWTLVVFFNSLRELGTTLSLLQSDIPDYLKVIRNRTGNSFSEIRQLWNILELTGRLRSDEVPRAISSLERSCTGSGKSFVDVCLASSIMEVGIDIDRLSLMTVVGQPKTTSQYIQVTGRVGRSWWERPGLVVTIYGASKPRDRSHFEKFKSYHERLYAQVEPTSVTPFSPPALDRALHAVMVSYVRQAGDENVAGSPYPFPEGIVNDLWNLVMDRVRSIAPEEAATVERVFKKRLSEWRRWQRVRWRGPVQEGDVPLLREAGAFINPEFAGISWPTPVSMRNVDAECQAEITNLYLNEGETGVA